MTFRVSRVAIWLMLASTLVLVPGGLIRFVFPKLFVVALAILVGSQARRGGRLPTVVLVLAGVGTAVFVVASFGGETPIASLLGRWPRYEGLPVLALYLGSAWLGARLLGGQDRAAHGAELVTALTAMSVILATFSGAELLGWSVLGATDATRAGSLLGNATDQGLVAMMAAAVLMGPALRQPQPFVLIGLASALATVAMSGSRASMAATLLSFVIHLAATRGHLVKQAATGLAGVVVLVLVLPGTRDRLGNPQTVTGRSELWGTTVTMLSDHPLLGVGPSRFVDAIGPYEDAGWVRDVGVDLVIDSPHSWPLQAASAGGVLLLATAAALAAVIVILGVRATRSRADLITVGLLAATTGYGIALLANFTIAGSTCLAAFLVGALVAVNADGPDEASESSWHRRLIPVAASIALVGTLSASIAEIDLQKGREAASRGDTPVADRAFTRASHWRPLDSDVAMIAAQALAGPANLGDPPAADAAERWANRSLARTPDSFDAGLARAVALLAQNRLSEARSTLDDLIAHFPVSPDLYVQRGIARFGLTDVVGARSDLATAERLGPADPTAARILAEINRRTDSSPAAD